MIMPSHASLRVCLLATLALGCGNSATELEIRAYGEYVEQGIPAEVFADGWTVEFSRFELTLQTISIAGEMLPDPEPLELTSPSEGQGHLVDSIEVEPGSYDDAAFAVELMQIEGTASKDGQSKSFAWTFPLIVYYVECDTTTEVPAGEVGQLQITVHAENLFHDSLVAEQPAVRFDELAAADSNGDDVITMQELGAAGLGSYDPSDIPDVDTLAAFLGITVTTMIRVDGDARCIPTTA
jgi:hypothetical protein